MNRMQQIGIPEMCDQCGESPITLHTRADQREKPEHCSFWAEAEDEVTCPACGARGLIVVDDEIAQVHWAQSDKAQSSDPVAAQ